MRLFPLVMVCLLAGCSVNVSAQTNLGEFVAGEWIQEGSKFTNVLGQLKDPSFGASYFKLDFEKNDVFYSTNPFERYQSMKYQIRGDTLDYGGKLFRIKPQGDHEFALIDLQTEDGTRFIRYRPDPMKSVPLIENDTILQFSEAIHPTYQGNFAQFFFDESWIFFPAPKYDRQVMVSFTLLKDGRIKDVNVTSDHSKYRNKKFRKSIYKSQKYWRTPVVNGQRMSTRVELVVIRKGARSIQNWEKAERNFQFGLRYLKKDPYAALVKFSSAQALCPDNAKFYFYKGISYYYLLDQDRMCQEFAKAKDLCPFLPMGIADNSLGVRIDCFRPKTTDAR